MGCQLSIPGTSFMSPAHAGEGCVITSNTEDDDDDSSEETEFV